MVEVTKTIGEVVLKASRYQHHDTYEGFLNHIRFAALGDAYCDEKNNDGAGDDNNGGDYVDYDDNGDDKRGEKKDE